MSVESGTRASPTSSTQMKRYTNSAGRVLNIVPKALTLSLICSTSHLFKFARQYRYLSRPSTSTIVSTLQASHHDRVCQRLSKGLYM